MRSESTVRQDELGDLARQIASQIKSGSQAENVLRPSFNRPAAPRPEQVAALNSIVRAADLIGNRQEQLLLMERRATEAEDQIALMKRQMAEYEDKLRAALDHLQRERRRSEDLEQRSADMLDRTQSMMTDASERLATSEKRAAQAEEYLATLQSMIRERFEHV